MSEYIRCADVAKMLRKALKAEFPRQKFSVRSETYAGGASIRVKWTDGPCQRAVQAVITRFEGSGFDGMTDYKYGKYHWLLPDGTIARRGVEAHYGNEGETHDKPHPDAKEVRLGADFIFANRDLSDSWISKCGAAWDALSGPEQCDLLNNHEFPRWGQNSIEGEDHGRALAAFLSVPA